MTVKYEIKFSEVGWQRWWELNSFNWQKIRVYYGCFGDPHSVTVSGWSCAHVLVLFIMSLLLSCVSFMPLLSDNWLICPTCPLFVPLAI